ncbi:Spermine oxidase [Chionoecetes opilio]|uniref:Spermine oxidase n=1 Tax=Chionoecetes opilio TaxID=41210 RepID=A0A8J4YC82_CHIOP|nr:Spermine oxidase [Chionoecetes opilio]KAG0718674.1 Spermine oxidase [Chionoecetes opilio]
MHNAAGRLQFARLHEHKDLISGPRVVFVDEKTFRLLRTRPTSVWARRQHQSRTHRHSASHQLFSTELSDGEGKFASAMDNSARKVRVCVIGAGISGLGAAQRLVEAGVEDIVLLEAEDRIGGRVHTVKHDDGQIEFGAHWIHGQENNVVYQWGSEKGLTSDELSWDQTGRGNAVYVRSDGDIVAQDIVDEFAKTFEELQESSKDDFADFPGSLGQYFTEKFKALNKWGPVGNELLNWESRFFDLLNGSDNWFQVSAKGLLKYKECPGNPVVNWKQGGYLISLII